MATTSPPLAFIITCPYIDVQDIPNDERNCPICTEPYHHLSDRANDRGVKAAKRLPCKHHPCHDCSDGWLNPFAKSNNNTCPLDRKILFPKLALSQTTEGIQQRLDLFDLFDGVRGRQLLGAERDETAGLKAELVERRPGVAIEELEVDHFTAETLMQSRINARKIDAAVPSARLQELQQFGHRLATIKAIC